MQHRAKEGATVSMPASRTIFWGEGFTDPSSLLLADAGLQDGAHGAGAGRALTLSFAARHSCLDSALLAWWLGLPG